MTKQRRSFSQEFKLNSAKLILDDGYSFPEAARSLEVGETALRRWVKQLQEERGGTTPNSKALTPEQLRIQEFEAKVNRLEREKTILKKATALLIRGAAGSRMLTVMLKDADLTAGVFKVRRIMRDMGLVCKQPGPHSYKLATAERSDIPNKLNREFKSYLAVIIDLFARRVVGWAMSDKPDTDLVIKALDRAYEQRGKPSGLMFHQIKAVSTTQESFNKDCGVNG
ncbi:UNVERIFIED_CONTAM: insO2 [Trichonephila clavipes]